MNQRKQNHNHRKTTGMYLRKDLKKRLLAGEHLRFRMNGKTAYCSMNGTGIVSRDLVMVSVYSGANHVACFGVHRGRFSIRRLRGLV